MANAGIIATSTAISAITMNAAVIQRQAIINHLIKFKKEDHVSQSIMRALSRCSA